MNFSSKPQALFKCLLLISSTLAMILQQSHAEVTLEQQVKITDQGLHFNGQDLDFGTVGNPNTSPDQYDYFFGKNISAHGDAVKTYKNYVFMTWYRGGKDDRHVMLSRFNTDTGVVKNIEFPHQHTGFRGDPLVGESHNTIGLSVSPVNGTIHMVYDMHAYDDNNHDGKFKNDYFRYSYSIAGAAEASDAEFTLAKFVKDTSSVSQGADDYKHLTMTGDLADKGNFVRLTYPKFFTNTDGTLLLYMRLGGNNNGGYVFNRYDATTQKWSKFTDFNVVSAKNFGNDYNWGLYGNMKYVNGKLRVGFQQRSSDNDDKYLYQNGVYYAYSDQAEGFGQWKNHKGEPMTWPLVNSDEIKVFEPGDYIAHQEANSVYIVGGFDWTVTAKGDIHIISEVRSTDRNRGDYQQVFLHSYKSVGADDFIVTTDFAGASEIYTSGDNVYIIGLKDGYPYVEQAIGGTNDFERIYEQTEGVKFDHGTVHVINGKVYYYLMERSSGTEQPLYLQIIDLDINSSPPAPVVNPVVSFSEFPITLTEGYKELSVNVNASSPSEERSISSVRLYINGQLISNDDTAPYSWHQTSFPDLTGLSTGTHLLKAVATDDAGNTAESSVSLIVETAPDPIVAFAGNSLQLQEGYADLSINVNASSPNSLSSIVGVTLYINNILISEVTTSPYTWSQTENSQLAGLNVGTHQLKSVAEDDNGKTAEALINLFIKAKIVEPAPEPDNNDSNTSTQSGGSTGPFLMLATLILVTLRRRWKRLC
ncbi:MAG: BNR-4 repeat-containing protein [Thalassotalea sp.]